MAKLELSVCVGRLEAARHAASMGERRVAEAMEQVATMCATLSGSQRNADRAAAQLAAAQEEIGRLKVGSLRARKGSLRTRERAVRSAQRAWCA